MESVVGAIRGAGSRRACKGQESVRRRGRRRDSEQLTRARLGRDGRGNSWRGLGLFAAASPSSARILSRRASIPATACVRNEPHRDDPFPGAAAMTTEPADGPGRNGSRDRVMSLVGLGSERESDHGADIWTTGPLRYAPASDMQDELGCCLEKDASGRTRSQCRGRG